MKKLLTLILVFVIILSTFVGCDTDNKTKIAERAIEKIEAVNNETERVEATEDIDDDKPDVSYVNSTEPEPDTVPEVLWSPENFIDFKLFDKEYKIGESCKSIIEDFEIVEIVDGHVLDDCTVHTGEKVTLNLTDGTNEFLVVIRNNMSQPVEISECTLHEVYIRLETFELSDIVISDTIACNSTFDEWVDAFGSDYADYSSEFMVCYSWMIADKCYVDVSFDENCENVTSVQMMMY